MYISKCERMVCGGVGSHCTHARLFCNFQSMDRSKYQHKLKPESYSVYPPPQLYVAVCRGESCISHLLLHVFVSFLPPPSPLPLAKPKTQITPFLSSGGAKLTWTPHQNSLLLPSPQSPSSSTVTPIPFPALSS